MSLSMALLLQIHVLGGAAGKRVSKDGFADSPQT